MSKKPESPQEEVCDASDFQQLFNTWSVRERVKCVGVPVQRADSTGRMIGKRGPTIDYSTKPRLAVKPQERGTTADLDVDLLLIGKTGNGKSATGNSILRRKAFESTSSTDSVTMSTEYEVTEFNGRVIKVVDSPGVKDTGQDIEGDVNSFLKNMEYAIAVNPRGFHAFLLVLRFGGRFTVEDRDTIAILKAIFGEDFVKNYCIIVMTSGDQFEQCTDETGETFEEWCSKQRGIFKELITECDNRVILFDNTTKDETKMCGQISLLLEIVDNLRSKGSRYTDENFAMAKEATERFILEAKKQLIREAVLTETSLILEKLQELEWEEEYEVKAEPLEELKSRSEAFLSIISSQDCGTGVLHELCETVTSLLRTIDDEIKFCSRVKTEIEKIRKTEEEKRRLLEDQILSERQEHEHILKEQQLLSEERRKLEMEQEKKRRDLEDREREEIKIMERKCQMELLKENLAFHAQFEEMKIQYRDIKKENNTHILKKVVSGIAWPFRKMTAPFSQGKKRQTTDSSFISKT